MAGKPMTRVLRRTYRWSFRRKSNYIDNLPNFPRNSPISASLFPTLWTLAEKHLPDRQLPDTTTPPFKGYSRLKLVQKTAPLGHLCTPPARSGAFGIPRNLPYHFKSRQPHCPAFHCSDVSNSLSENEAISTDVTGIYSW